MNRKQILSDLSDLIKKIHLDHPIRIGIDGVDASGKTTFANELTKELKDLDRQIIRASIDGFHNPREIRYKKGRNSPEGYYFDSFDNNAIIKNILEPLSSDGDLNYRTAIFNFKTNSPVEFKIKKAEKNAILIMEGVFLFRPELVNYWDLKIFIDSDFDVILKRAIKRDGYYLGSENNIIEKYEKRYIPGQKIYIEKAKPMEKAD